MRSQSLRGFGARRSRLPRRGAFGARRPGRVARRPGLEPLERRLTLTGNITITGVSVVNQDNEPLTTISAGQQVFMQADFTTQDLPSNASYRIEFEVNGLIAYTGYLNWGAGASGTADWDAVWGTFVACPGSNQVTVVVDPDESVPETTYSDNTMSTTFTGQTPVVGYLSYTAAQIRAAYGISSIPDFGTATPDGTGQTIALIEAGNEPTILSDLDGFDQAMSLGFNTGPTIYQKYGPASSFATVYNQDGVNITADIADSGTDGVPAEDPTGHWEGEETLDVEWAHAIAPGAKIDIIEVDDNSNWGTNLLNGNALAASLPGVSAISNSYGLSEGSYETAYDTSTFVTPSGHTGVTFLTCSNDNGAHIYPSPYSGGYQGYYPATSPNVVSVGGTQLTTENNGYGSEIGWSFPAPASTADYGGSSFAQTGSWVPTSGGFSGILGTAAGGSSATATWTIPVTPANTGWGTELSVTWFAAAGDATNATYTVYNGAGTSGTVLGTITVNQAQAPVGTAYGGFQFQELGVFFPTLNSSGDGTMTVVLSAAHANGTVVADAIGSAQAWASTGGPSPVESEPAYQDPIQSTAQRTTPDVSFDASGNSGVDTDFEGSLGQDAAGTSLSSPCWAGLIAIANQGRVADGGTELNSSVNPQQTLYALYALPASDFHDITTGYNGYVNTPGYDFVTGRGTPIANLLIPDLASYDLPTRVVVTAEPPSSVTAGASFGLTVKVEDNIGDVIGDYDGPVTVALSNNPGGSTLEGTLTVNAYEGVAVFSGLTLNKVGTGYTLIVTGGSQASGATTAIKVTPAAAAYLAFGGFPAYATAGTPFTFTVTAEDRYGNVATGYTGTIHFTSHDPTAILPANFPFTAADDGTYGFSATLKTGGVQTIAATDTVTSTINGEGVTTVTAAAFLKSDTTTEGNWIGAYGAQGYDVAGYTADIPSSAVVTNSGATTYSWSSSTTDPRAPENPATYPDPDTSASRVADTWYATDSTSFTVNVDLTDGQTHVVALYFLDWPGAGRAETIQLSNAATGAVLGTRSISSFADGVYLQWTISGDVTFTVTKTAGPNAVLSGIFFDPFVTSAAYIKEDTTTEGNWIGAYGAQGYNAVGYTTRNPSYPSYAVLTPSGAATYSWTSSTTDPRAPEDPATYPTPDTSASRVADTWYSTDSTSFTVNIDLTDGQTHAVALYFLDWPDAGRAETIQLTSEQNGDLLDTRSISSFSGGIYLQWAISGDVTFTITRTAGPNAVLSGIFFDPATSPPTTSATYVKEDTTTEGNWIGAYGAQGYNDVGYTTRNPSYPSYAIVTPSLEATYSWSSSTTDPRALENPASYPDPDTLATRLADAWYATNSDIFTVTVDITDGQTHDVALYFLDWPDAGRAETILLTSGLTGALLDSRSISSFSDGVYLQWAISGDVNFTITKTAGPNAVLSGIFFDPATSGGAFVPGSQSADPVVVHSTLQADSGGPAAIAGSPEAAGPAAGPVAALDLSARPASRAPIITRGPRPDGNLLRAAARRLVLQPSDMPRRSRIGGLGPTFLPSG